jgi:hypothetical protein
MSTVELLVSYRPDDEWNGQLDVVVKSGAFAGRGSAWFGRQRLRETFVAALRTYPLSTSNLPLIEGGFGNKKHPESLEQCHVRIAVRPYDIRGNLLVQGDLATECWKTPDQDLVHSVSVRFVTGYAALDDFAARLEQVLDGTRQSALLSGTPQ